ncbi:MAG: phosphoglucomutase, partial [Bacteroidetes bacterium]|nr:phosphoglucomutase [Bacteroidota bacterium]
MTTERIIFGTDGWRALLDNEINGESVRRVAQALADYTLKRSSSPSVAIGYDGRRDSRFFAEQFSSVLTANGITVHLSGSVVPTPALSWFVHAHKLDVGVMVTASHNPPEYNGIKFKAAYGGPFTTEETLQVEALLGKSPVRTASAPVPVSDMLGPYLRQLRSFVDLPRIARSGISVAVDSMSGAGGELLGTLLREEGIQARTIFGQPATDFSGRLPEPIEKNLLPLREFLQNGSFSLGVATDGDADRLGVLMENGEWLSSQETIVLLADHIRNGKGIAGDLIKTSSVTGMLDAHFASSSCTVHDVQVGFKYICETMLRTDAAFGAEESGGYGYKGHIPERDGILSALLMMEMLALSGHRTLSGYVAAKRQQFGRIWYDRIDHPYHGADRTERLPALERNRPAS